MSKDLCQSCGRSWTTCQTHLKNKKKHPQVVFLFRFFCLLSSISSNKMQLLHTPLQAEECGAKRCSLCLSCQRFHPTHTRATSSPATTKAAPPRVTAPAALLPLQFLSFMLPPTPSALLASVLDWMTAKFLTRYRPLSSFTAPSAEARGSVPTATKQEFLLMEKVVNPWEGTRGGGLPVNIFRTSSPKSVIFFVPLRVSSGSLQCTFPAAKRISGTVANKIVRNLWNFGPADCTG